MLVAGLLAASAFVILSTRTIDPGKELPPGCSDTAERATGKPKECPRFPTRLGLDLQGGTELIYEARPTPKVPEVKPENIDDALETIRKRTDSLGVSEPEIQRAGATQISIGLPAVKDADRARKQVGATAQLQFYDWEPNLFTSEGPPISFAEAQKRGEAAAETPLTLFQAVERASKLKPRPEPDDVPPGGPAKDVQDRFRGDQRKVQEFYDRQNDTGQDKYYVFLPDKRLLPAGEDEPTPPADLGDENPATQFY